MNLSDNGLQDFPEERHGLAKCANFLLETSLSEKGHLGNSLACIKTVVSILNIYAESIQKEFDKQKQDEAK